MVGQWYRERDDERLYTKFEIQLIAVAQAPVKAIGRIIRGVTLP
jgi:hypothetical protein